MSDYSSYRYILCQTIHLSTFEEVQPSKSLFNFTCFVEMCIHACILVR